MAEEIYSLDDLTLGRIFLVTSTHVAHGTLYLQVNDCAPHHIVGKLRLSFRVVVLPIVVFGNSQLILLLSLILVDLWNLVV